MTVWEKSGFDYVNTSNDCLVGCALMPTSTFGQCDQAVANTSVPLGISKDQVTKVAAAPWPTVTVETIRGSVVKMIASAAIAVLAQVTATTAGTMATVTKLAGAGITVSASPEYSWGTALVAAANANEYFTALFDVNEIEQA